MTKPQLIRQARDLMAAQGVPRKRIDRFLREVNGSSPAVAREICREWLDRLAPGTGPLVVDLMASGFELAPAKIEENMLEGMGSEECLTPSRQGAKHIGLAPAANLPAVTMEAPASPKPSRQVGKSGPLGEVTSNPGGFHLRKAARDLHVCPRCGDRASYGRLCRNCQVSQIPYAGYIFAKRKLE